MFRSNTIKETFIRVAGHEIPQIHPERIYDALRLITSPIRVSDEFRGEVQLTNTKENLKNG